MTETRHGSADGRFTHPYEAGETYDADTTPPMSDDLAAVFLREGWAIDADTPDELVAVADEPLPAAKRARKVTGPTETKE
jgi:hypothetical protein